MGLEMRLTNEIQLIPIMWVFLQVNIKVCAATEFGVIARVIKTFVESCPSDVYF